MGDDLSNKSVKDEDWNDIVQETRRGGDLTPMFMPLREWIRTSSGEKKISTLNVILKSFSVTYHLQTGPIYRDGRQ